MDHRSPGRKRGFTLIELSVVVLVLAILAASLVPKLQSYKRSSDERAFFNRLPALAESARESARSSGSTRILSFSESDGRFAIETEDSDEAQAGLLVPEDIVTRSSRVGSDDTAGGDWSIRFFSDGTCEGGAIELDSGGRSRTLVIDARSGRASWTEGEIPDSSGQKWQAGELEIRGQGDPRR